MIIPTDHSQLLAANLHNLVECAETLSKLNKTNKEKDTNLTKLRTDSNTIRNRLHSINDDIQTLEKENIRLNERIQSHLDRQNHVELRSFTKNASIDQKLEAFRAEMTTIGEVLGLNLDRISLRENDLIITFPDPQNTTLVFQDSQGPIKLVSISPPHPNFEIIQQHLQRTGDLVGLIISLYKIKCLST